MFKAYKYRIYPDNQQRIQLAKTFGCVRFVYNQALAYRKTTYETEQKSLSKTDCNNWCNRELKPQYDWLREVDKFAFTNAIYNMDTAYQKFFKEGAGYPRFKSKHSSRQAYTASMTNGNIAVDFEGGTVKLPKLRHVKTKLHRQFTGNIKNATVSQDADGKYYVSLLIGTERQELAHTDKSVGLDSGLTDLCVTSDGNKYENPRTLRKYEKKLARLQRSLVHKNKGSRNREKARKKVAVCHAKIRNMRRKHLHQISAELIRENQVIVSENLQIKNMEQNRHLAKTIADASWYELTRQLEYKAQWNGRQYQKVDAFYASSQICSQCGHQNPETKDLSIRQWTCPMCGRSTTAIITPQKTFLRKACGCWHPKN